MWESTEEKWGENLSKVDVSVMWIWTGKWGSDRIKNVCVSKEELALQNKSAYRASILLNKNITCAGKGATGCVGSSVIHWNSRYRSSQLWLPALQHTGLLGISCRLFNMTKMYLYGCAFAGLTRRSCLYYSGVTSHNCGRSQGPKENIIKCSGVALKQIIFIWRLKLQSNGGDVHKLFSVLEMLFGLVTHWKHFAHFIHKKEEVRRSTEPSNS